MIFFLLSLVYVRLLLRKPSNFWKIKWKIERKLFFLECLIIPTLLDMCLHTHNEICTYLRMVDVYINAYLTNTIMYCWKLFSTNMCLHSIICTSPVDFCLSQNTPSHQAISPSIFTQLALFLIILWAKGNLFAPWSWNSAFQLHFAEISGKSCLFSRQDEIMIGRWFLKF